jgi:hypothetical protein
MSTELEIIELNRLMASKIKGWLQYSAYYADRTSSEQSWPATFKKLDRLVREREKLLEKIISVDAL